MKYFKLVPVYSLLLLLVASPVSAETTKETLKNTRIFEDGIFMVVFIVLGLFSLAMIKATKGGLKNVSFGYSVLLISSIAGFFWKLLGFLNRAFNMKEPKWLFDIARESLEGATGLIFAVAFMILFFAITRKKV